MSETEISSEVMDYRLGQLEAAMRDLKKTTDERSGALDGRLMMMHDQLTRLAAAQPGSAPYCQQHQFRLVEMEKHLQDLEERTAKQVAGVNTRLDLIERKVWYACGVLAAVMAAVSWMAPVVRDQVFSGKDAPHVVVVTNAPGTPGR